MKKLHPLNNHLKTPVRLQHIDGRTAAADSITSFCKRHMRHVPNARFHVGAILSRQRWQHHGWHLPVEDDGRTIVHINGKTEKVGNWIATAKALRMNINHFRQLLEGTRKYNRGWYLAGTPPPRPPHPHFVFFFRSPRGNIIKTTNVSALSRKMRVECSGLRHLTGGQLHAHRGWTLHGVSKLI